MRRRDILTGAGSSLAAGAALSIPAPAIAQGIRQLKMVTDWPESLPGLQASAVRFARTVGTVSGGRIKIEVFPAGTLVRPFGYARSRRHAVELCIELAQDAVVAPDETSSMVAEQGTGAARSA